MIVLTSYWYDVRRKGIRKFDKHCYVVVAAKATGIEQGAAKGMNKTIVQEVSHLYALYRPSRNDLRLGSTSVLG